MAAMSSVLSPEKAMALSAPWPTVLTMNTSPMRATAAMPRPIRWMRVSPAPTRWSAWRKGWRLSIDPAPGGLDAHAHDFGVGIDQLVADLKRYREAETGLFRIEHHLMDVDRLPFGQGQGRRVGLAAQVAQGADGVFEGRTEVRAGWLG